MPRRSRYTRTTRSPIASNARGAASTGTRAVIATVLAKMTNGAARKSQEAFRETTTSLPKSFRSSRYGCQNGAPRRFWSRAFIQRISPTSPGARSSASDVCPTATA